MNLTFIQVSAFAARWARAKLTDEDLQALERSLGTEPAGGDVMAGTGGVRKVRFAPPSNHAGKRGGLRVAYAYVRVADVIYLLDVFAKNEQANFTAAEKATMRRLAAALADLHCRP